MTFVIMKEYNRPGCICIPGVHSVVQGPKKKVNEIVETLNRKAVTNHYFLVPVKSGVTYV